MKKITIAILMFILIPVITYADCESDFKKVEKDFSISYKYNKDTDDFTITLVSPDRNKYTFGFSNPDDVKDAYWTNEGNKKITTIRGYKKEEYKYMLLGMYGDCKDYIAKEGTISLNKNDSVENSNEETLEKEAEKSNKKHNNKTTSYIKEHMTETIIIIVLVIAFIITSVVITKKDRK